MQAPDLTPNVRMTYAMCRAVNGACRCESRKYPQHCESMELAGRGIMAAAGMSEAGVMAVLEGKPAEKAPAKSVKKPKAAA